MSAVSAIGVAPLPATNNSNTSNATQSLQQIQDKGIAEHQAKASAARNTAVNSSVNIKA